MIIATDDETKVLRTLRRSFAVGCVLCTVLIVFLIYVVGVVTCGLDIFEVAKLECMIFSVTLVAVTVPLFILEKSPRARWVVSAVRDWMHGE
jgi:hypothetical protein